MAAADDNTASRSVAEVPPDFVLLGPTGYLGSALLHALESAGNRVATSRVRLQDRSGIERLLDENRPTVGVICAAGERGRPNVSWCDSHPVETVDANITGQLNVAAACHARGLHATLLGTGMLYSVDPAAPDHKFREDETPNVKRNVYIDLRVKMEELMAYFDNVLVLRVLFPVSADLDRRGLIGKLARFERVDKVQCSVTVLDDLFPLVAGLARNRVKGVLNFTNSGTVEYAEIINELSKVAPAGWRRPQIDADAPARPACELDVERLAAASGQAVPDARSSVLQIIARLGDDELRHLLPDGA